MSGDVGFATFQTVERRPLLKSKQFEAWANASGGEYWYLSGWGLSTPPIVDPIPSGKQMLIRSDAAIPEASSWLLLLLASYGSARPVSRRLRFEAHVDAGGAFYNIDASIAVDPWRSCLLGSRKRYGRYRRKLVRASSTIWSPRPLRIAFSM